MSAIARAAAVFIVSVIAVARTSSAPRNTPGKHEHVVDLVGVVRAPGGDDPGVAARPPRARPRGPGWPSRTRSGRGSSSPAPRRGPRARRRGRSAGRRPRARRPAARRGARGWSARPAARLTGAHRPVEVVRALDVHGPARVAADRCAARPPRAGSRATATPAAPRPDDHDADRRRSAARSGVSAFSSAASTTTAVPCWSSWKTGMSSSALSRSSISKQRGAEMSSRLIPPNPGRDRLDDARRSRRVAGVQADREGVDAAELLEQHRLALHHRHRRARADVAQPEHGGPVGDHGDRVALDRVLEGLVGIVVDRAAHPGDARRVGHREVVAGLQRALVVQLDLAARRAA